MKPEYIIRRAQLGLAVSGPFNRNRRREWRFAWPYFLSFAVTASAIAFILSIFL